MKFENVYFNLEFIKEQNLNLEDFVAYRGYQHLWPDITPAKRKQRLKQLYKLLNPAA